MIKYKKLSKIFLVSSVVALAGFVVVARAPHVRAADTDFSDGITVDSIQDSNDANIGDGICADSLNRCTFRAAIEEANAHSGPDTIKFGISGSGVHTIALDNSLGALDAITSPVTIDGFSQTGSSPNTTAWPQPLNAHITIAIDASNFVGHVDIMRMNSSASGSVMKGLSIYSDDIINSHAYVLDNFANNVTVSGSYLGLPPNGQALATTYSRTVSNDGANFTLGGSTPSSRNLIYGASGIAGTSPTIRGNYFGADYTGLAPAASASIGDDSCLTVGETAIGTQGSGGTVTNNLISGCLGRNAGLTAIGAGGTTITNNYIGVDYTGLAALSNNGAGLQVAPTSSTGDTVTNNIIGGNGDAGITLDGASNVVQGNSIGVGVDGSTVIPNAAFGIAVFGGSSNNIIGGTGAGEGNIIVGSIATGGSFNGFLQGGGTGVSIEGTANVLQGNYIGVDATGVTAAANEGGGVVDIGSGTIIGGTSASAGNVISGNTGDGILLSGAQTIVQGNTLGLSADHASEVANSGANIRTQFDTTEVLIGGTVSGAANMIYAAGGPGVAIESNAGQNVSVLGNAIYDNSALGIDIASNGVSANDANDSDGGANDGLNFPASLTYDDSGTDTTYRYDLDVPAGQYRIEFFSNTAADASGYGQGEVLVDSQTVTSTGTGSQSFSHVVNATGLQNTSATATLIDNSSSTGYGPTSEFSATATQYTPPPPPPLVSDVGVSQVITNPQATAIGATLHYTLTFTNHGPDDVDLNQFDGSGGNPFATSLFTDVLPSDLSFVPGSSTNPDIDCSWYGAGSASFAGTYLPNHSDAALAFCSYTGGTHLLASGQSISTTFNVTVNNNSDLTFTNYVTTALDISADPDNTTLNTGFDGSHDYVDYFTDNPINNFSVSIPYSDLSVMQAAVAPFTVTPGSTVSYDVMLGNRGPQGIDLIQLSSGSASLFVVLYPASDLTFVNTTTAHVQCTDLGPGSSAYLGTAATNHSSYQLVVCGFDPSFSYPLTPGSSLTSRLNFTVNPGTHTSFSNFAFNTAIPSDPDVPGMNVLLSGSDQLDTFTNDNFARTVFSAAQTGGGSGTGTGGSGASAGSVTNPLASTGENRTLLLVGAVVLIIIGGTVPFRILRYRKRRL